MHPVADKRLFPRVAFALGDFVLVVGKDEVLPAAMDIKLLAQVF